MKIFKSFFVLALMALTFTASADNEPDGQLLIKSKVVEQNVLVVQLVNLQQEATRVSIQSLDGDTTFFQENIRKHNGYIRKINLENLKDGRYLIEVTQDDIAKKQVILIRDGQLRLSAVKG